MMTTSVRLQGNSRVSARIDSEVHESAAEWFVNDLLERDFWKHKPLPDCVGVIARVGVGGLHIVRVDILTHPVRRAYVGGLARKCNRLGEEV